MTVESAELVERRCLRQIEAAHELNNWLTVIVSHAALIDQLARGAREGGGDERWLSVSRDLASVRTAAAHCTEIARELAGAARDELGGPPPPLRP